MTTPINQQIFNEVIEQTKTNVKKLQSLQAEISSLKVEQDNKVKSFLVEITKNYFDFNQNPYLPINANSFLVDITIKQQDQSFGFYGLRFEFRGHKLISTDKHTFISFDDWQNLPDAIKQVNFEERKNSELHFAETATIYVQEYRAGKTIIENDNYLLSWVKPYSTSNSELILYSKNIEKSQFKSIQAKMLEALAPLNIDTLTSSVRHQYSGFRVHHVIHSGGRLNRKLIDTVSSHIITIFGEDGLTSVYNKLDKQQEINKIKIKPPKTNKVEKLDFDPSKLKL